jgi:formylglycine-generating enzyme required for sulfatase activity
MRKMLLLLLVLHNDVWANEETTVDLLGGATMEMVWIEAGTFTMGSKGGRTDEGPQHEVTISRGFYLGKYETTQGQWEAVMGTTPWSGKELVQENPNSPAVYISFDDMQAFVDRLNEAAGAFWYRLPTEAEWEYAARAGTTTLWSFGTDLNQLLDYAWYNFNAKFDDGDYAHAVGTKLPNPWGLYDMHGNVYEVVQDWWGLYESGSQIDPQGPSTPGSPPRRIVRSGSFQSGGEISTYSARRIPFDPDALPTAIGGVRLLRLGPEPTAVTPQSWGQIKDGQ